MASAGSGGCTVGTVCGTDDPSTWPSQDPTRSHRRSYEPWSPTEPRWTKAVGGGDTDAPSPTTQDQIYHCLHYGLGDSKAYDLVLLDEAQDLNPLQHHFLRQCVIPTASRTNLCPDPPTGVRGRPALWRGRPPTSRVPRATGSQLLCSKRSVIVAPICKKNYSSIVVPNGST